MSMAAQQPSGAPVPSARPPTAVVAVMADGPRTAAMADRRTAAASVAATPRLSASLRVDAAPPTHLPLPFLQPPHPAATPPPTPVGGVTGAWGPPLPARDGSPVTHSSRHPTAADADRRLRVAAASAATSHPGAAPVNEIGRASCRERV